MNQTPASSPRPLQLIVNREHSQQLAPDLLRRMREQRDWAENRLLWVTFALLISGTWNLIQLVLWAVEKGWLD